VREQFCLLVVKKAGAHDKPDSAPAATCPEEEGSGQAKARTRETGTARDA
jgi:hypothetical protein